MKADKFAVTKMTRFQIVNLILENHQLFPHLLTSKGTKGTKYNKPKPKTKPQTSRPKSSLPQLEYKPSKKVYNKI